KYGQRFNYRPQFKVWMVSNWRLNADPGDDAIWARPLTIHFPVSHYGAENTHLKEELRKKENLEGVLRWAVEGAMLWYKEGLNPPPEVLQEATKHRYEQDTVLQWLEDGPCVHDKDGNETILFSQPMKDEPEYYWESSADLTKSYKEWCLD